MNVNDGAMCVSGRLFVKEMVSNIKASVMARGWVQSLFLVYFMFFSVALFAYSTSRPIQNWDLVAYVGSVKSLETDDKVAIHDYAYSSLKSYADDNTYTLLTAGSDYRKKLFTDPESFSQVLPWYQIRPVYTGLMYVMNKFGMNIYSAGHLISAVSVVLGLWVFYFAFRHYIASTIWFSIPLFVLMNGNVEVARLGSPDGLAFLYTAILTRFFLRRSKYLYLLLPLSIFVRTDLIFLVGLTLGYLFLKHKKQRLMAVLSLLASVFIYLAINKYFGNYGWTTVFYLVFVSDFTLNYPATTTVTVTLRDYIYALFDGGLDILITDAFDIFIAIFALHLGVSLRLTGMRASFHSFFSQRINAIAVISFVYVVVHFLVFPAGYSRFFAAQYLLIILAFLALLNRVSGITPLQEPTYSNK
jgi:hypothetical protein